MNKNQVNLSFASTMQKELDNNKHKEQIKEANKNYRQSHKQEIKEYYKLWRIKNKQHICEYNREYIKQYIRKEKTPEQKEYMKEYMRRYCQLWRQNNKEKMNRWYKEYYYNKPNKRLLNQKRQFIKKGGGELSIQTIQQVYEDNIKQFGTLTCYLCLKPIEFKQDSIDHKIPLSRNGTNEYSNLAIAHRSCNSKKNIKTEKEYKKCLTKIRKIDN